MATPCECGHPAYKHSKPHNATQRVCNIPGCFCSNGKKYTPTPDQLARFAAGNALASA